MLWMIAWRNLWADKRRAVLKIALSALSAVFLIFAISFQNGQHNKMIRDAVEIYTGYVQITGQGYQDNPDYDHLIYNVDEVMKNVSTQPHIKESAVRFETFALFSAEDDSVGGLMVAIEPEHEARLSRIKRSLIKGSYDLSADRPEVLIGDKLAKRLGIGLGDSLTFISQSADMSMAAGILTVTGIFSTGSEMDARTAFVHKTYFDQIFLTHNMATHIVLLPDETTRHKHLPSFVRALNDKLEASYQAVGWEVPLASLVQMVELDNAFGYFSLAILVGVVFFVIMIFAVISVFQRTREIGVLRAVGTRPRQIVLMLMAESFYVGLIGAGMGVFIGWALVYYFYIHPIFINVPPEILEQYQKWGVVDFVFPTDLSWPTIIGNALFIWFLNILTVIYPAGHVTGRRPIQNINYV